MNTLKIEPADMTLNYDCGEITKSSAIYFNGSHVGYVGYASSGDYAVEVSCTYAIPPLGDARWLSCAWAM